jgi:hypothetical protein
MSGSGLDWFKASSEKDKTIFNFYQSNFAKYTYNVLSCQALLRQGTCFALMGHVVC